MPRATITKQTIPNAYDADGSPITMTAMNATDGNQILAGNDLVIIQNTGAGPHLVTIDSVADPTYQRTGDVSFSVPAGAFRMFRLAADGFKQSNGYINIDGANAELLIAVLDL